MDFLKSRVFEILGWWYFKQRPIILNDNNTAIRNNAEIETIRISLFFFFWSSSKMFILFQTKIKIQDG